MSGLSQDIAENYTGAEAVTSEVGWGRLDAFHGLLVLSGASSRRAVGRLSRAT